MATTPTDPRPQKGPSVHGLEALVPRGGEGRGGSHSERKRKKPLRNARNGCRLLRAAANCLQ
eukprot:15476702-Alexandrium_andersonii.AAC.1